MNIKDVNGCRRYSLRYIGSKTLLLENIEKIIKKHTTGHETTFCDIFSGTGVVARYFKPMYEIYTNDTLHFSYVIQKATIENNQIPSFSGFSFLPVTLPCLKHPWHKSLLGNIPVRPYILHR